MPFILRMELPGTVRPPPKKRQEEQDDDGDPSSSPVAVGDATRRKSERSLRHSVQPLNQSIRIRDTSDQLNKYRLSDISRNLLSSISHLDTAESLELKLNTDHHSHPHLLRHPPAPHHLNPHSGASHHRMSLVHPPSSHPDYGMFGSGVMGGHTDCQYANCPHVLMQTAQMMNDGMESSSETDQQMPCSDPSCIHCQQTATSTSLMHQQTSSQHHPQQSLSGQHQQQQPNNSAVTSSICDIQMILAELKFLTNRLRREDEVGDIVNEWRGAAMVIDRFCLIMFTAFTVTSTLICITSAPHLVV